LRPSEARFCAGREFAQKLRGGGFAFRIVSQKGVI
jgi:hypothetical protein